VGGPAKFKDAAFRRTISSLAEALNERAFRNYTVKDALWGADNTLVKIGNGARPEGKKLPYGNKFGFFVNVSLLE